MASGSRPPKLRNACMECTAAKVKCSGEKTGCKRCQKSGAECLYIESRIGRVPRTKKPHTPENGPSNRQTVRTSYSSTAQSDNSSSSSAYLDPMDPATPASGDMLNQLPPTTADWTSVFASLSANDLYSGEPGALNATMDPDLFFHHSRNSSLVPHEIAVDGSIFPPGPHQLIGNPDFGAGNSMMLQQQPGAQDGYATRSIAESMATNTSAVPAKRTMLGGGPTTIPTTTTTTTTGAEYLDRQCVFAATQIINILENCRANSSSRLDVVLEIVRKASVGFNRMLSLQERSRRSHRCLALFGAILHQILELLEAACDGFAHSNNSGSSSSGGVGESRTSIRSTTTTTSRPPTSGGGALEQLDKINDIISGFDPDLPPELLFGGQHHELWAQKLMEELEFALDTVARMMELVEGSRAEDGSSEGEKANVCLVVTKKRFLELQQKVLNYKQGAK